jgi:Protein of unknown function (DUF998)
MRSQPGSEDGAPCQDRSWPLLRSSPLGASSPRPPRDLRSSQGRWGREAQEPAVRRRRRGRHARGVIAISLERSVWRDAAGLWGPAAFVLATLLGARRQSGYSHRRHHISGLAAQHTRSAVVMIPGFMALGAATLAMPCDHRGQRALLRVAGAGTILAGAFRSSDMSCRDPTSDPEATAVDSAHEIASTVMFVAWTLLPFVDASHRGSPRSRAITVGNGLATAVGFVVAGVMDRSNNPNKGIAQRVFLGSVFAWYITNAFRRLSRSSDSDT